MPNCTPSHAQEEGFVTQMTERMTETAQRLSQWVAAEPRTLEEMEHQTLKVIHELGNALLAGLCSLHAPAYPEAEVACSCGQSADYQRIRSVHVDTLLGTIDLSRPYYLCSSCHHGLAPLDRQLGVCAGGISAGLAEILALVGAQFPFEEAVALIDKLTLVKVSPNLSQQATEALGQVIEQQEQQAISEAWDVRHPTLPDPPPTAPERLYISMDGTTFNSREDEWKEVKLGAVYTTITLAPKKRPDQLEVRARDITFYADVADPQTFGRGLWLEAYRRGVKQAKERVVIGDGAHWIWKLADEHFPGAIQIVDWYHATEYIWKVAHAIYGEGTDLAKQWARHRLDELWEGQVDEVLHHFEEHRPTGDVVEKAITYYVNNQARMRYPEYRAQGLQIGSGSIESGCKHVLGARLKQAGMIWNIAGARAVAKVRSRLKSRRWDETIAQCPAPSRSYHRRAA